MSKYTLYSTTFSPFSRKVRFFLDEKGIDYQLTEIKFWTRDKEFLKLNPANEVPVLKNLQTKDVICDSYLICEYIDEVENNDNELSYFNFLGKNLKEKYEIQRLHMWFDKIFYNEVSKYFIDETYLNFLKGNKQKQNSVDKINIGLSNLKRHIQYMEFLLSKRKWLAGEIFSIADIAASTQLSVLDYIGYIDWNEYQKLKEWYITIKSKKGFKNMLYEKISGFQQSEYYSKLDF